MLRNDGAPSMTLPILIDVNAALVFIGIAVFVHHRRPPGPLWPTLLIVQLTGLLWIAGDLGSLLARDLFWEQASISLVYAGSFGMFASWWVLGFRFAETHGVRPVWATPKVVWAPVVFALFGWLCATTNPFHGQFLTPIIGARNDYHWLWWVLAPTGYFLMICIAIGYAFLDRHFDDAPSSRKQCRTMLLATLIGLLSNTAYTLLPVNWPLDLSIFGGLVTGLIFVFGIYRGTLFDLSPAAFMQLLNDDPTPLLIVNRTGRLLYANPRAHALFEGIHLAPNCLIEDKLRGSVFRSNLNENAVSLDQVWTNIERGDVAGAFYLLSDSETKKHLWMTGQAVGEPGAKVEALSIRIHDITRIYDLEAEKRRMEGQLAHNDRLRSLGTMAAGIAHEVNNPVGSALLAAEFALLRLGETSDALQHKEIATEALKIVIDQSQRAARVTRSMLRFAREGSGDRVISDIRLAVIQAVQFTRELARKHGAFVNVESPNDLAPVNFNSTEMEQVFVNLVHNAILSGKPGRTVDLRTEEIDSFVLVTVSDNGSGMTTEQCKRVFEPFHTSRSASTGTGLGLSVVHGIVTDHGGEVWLESELGLGTTAHVKLPVSKSDANGRQG